MPKHSKSTSIKNKMSIFKRMVWLFVLAMMLNSLILFPLLLVTGTFDRMHEDALNILAEVTRNKYQELGSKMVRWSNLDNFSDEINGIVAKSLSEAGKQYTDIADDVELNAALVQACAPAVVKQLQDVDVSGVFLILNGQGVPNDPESKAGFFLRDSNPVTQSKTNSDVYILRGLPPLSRLTGITLDSYWQASFHFEGGVDNAANHYFYKPLEAFASNPKINPKYDGYWSGRFTMNEKDNTPIFTYSRPLVGSDGTAYGVLGIKLDATYISSVINNGEYDERSNRICYFLGYSDDEGQNYQNVFTSGIRFERNFDEHENLVGGERIHNGKNSFLKIKGSKSGEMLMGAIKPLSIYSPNTIYSKEQWVLIGIQESDALFALENGFLKAMITVIILGLGMGFVIALLAARSISKPIITLVGQLKNPERGATQFLNHTGLAEVDVLVDTISALSRNLVEDASKISKIITLSGLPVGVFEKRYDQQETFCSDGFFKLLSCNKLYNDVNSISEKEFDRLMTERLGSTPAEGSDTFLVNGIDESRYIRLKILCDQKGVIGTLMDVTEEIKNRHRIEYERDYDLLTNIFNRRAFEKCTLKIFAGDDACVAPVSALLMMDLDNLKKINDAYGHECGDLYISAFAKGLDYLKSERCFAARRSGDEFYIFYYGYQSKDEIRAIISEGWDKLMSEKFLMPDGTSNFLCASAGLAWYPDDSTEFFNLVHLADFAMYRVKNSVKGSMEEFNREDYNEADHLFNGRHALNCLLDDKLVRFMLQPIVSAVDGSVFGYELLMRPQVDELPTPMAVLSLAKNQGELYFVELLTWDSALQTACELKKSGALTLDAKLFINSIANQLLTDEDEERLHQKYGMLCGDIVMEIAQIEQNNVDYVRRKLDHIKQFGGTLAIDDFGAGYKSDIVCLTIDASYIKLDIAFIHDVDKDEDKRAWISNVVNYAKKHNISVIAVGVETYGELETLMRLGVDYFQGYYIAHPAYVPPVPTDLVVNTIQRLASNYKRRRVKA